MSVIVTAEVTKPENVELTVTIRMPVAGWREVYEALKGETFSQRWHATHFCDDIKEAIRDVEHKALKISNDEPVR